MNKIYFFAYRIHKGQPLGCITLPEEKAIPFMRATTTSRNKFVEVPKSELRPLWHQYVVMLDAPIEN